MRTLRITSNTLAILILILIGGAGGAIMAEAPQKLTWDFISQVLWVILALSFYGLLIWLPGYVKGRKYQNLVTWICFILNLLSITAVGLVIYVIRHIEC